MDKRLKDAFETSGKFLFRTLIVSILLYAIHEIGHIVAQILVGFPIRFGFEWEQLGITTTAGLGIMTQPPQIFYPITIAGLIATLIPIRCLKKYLWFPKEFEKYISLDLLKTQFYILLSFLLASYDIALIFLYTFIFHI